jgi:oligopeptide/dipeptide ABC transporter ATP-binding protein
MIDASTMPSLSVEVASNTPSGESLLEVDDLRVEVRSGRAQVTLVDGISYRVRAGEAVGLVGESGAGKSIGIRAVLGLLDPHRFNVSGVVKIMGEEVSALSLKSWQKRMSKSSSLVFQDPTRSLNPTMKVGRQIAEALCKVGAREGRLSKDVAHDQAVQLMADVGIADPKRRFSSYPHELSGGMRQRIVIAIALSCRPRLIFCDEPTTSLDVTTQAQIMDLLQGLREKLSIGLVLVTHDLPLAISRVDRVMVMYAGRLVETLDTATAVSESRMPYTRALLEAVPGGLDGHAIPDPIPGGPPDPRDMPVGCAFEPRCAYADEKCREERPEIEQLELGHLIRCWHPVALTKAEVPGDEAARGELVDGESADAGAVS